jgi:hypothetical protein
MKENSILFWEQKTITTYNYKMLESYNQITKSPISPVLKTLIKQLFFILGEKFNPTVLKYILSTAKKKIL